MSNATSETTLPAEADAKIEKPRDDSALLRGALKIEISTATQIVSAGSEFSIYVVIRNPFPVPVTLHRTETNIPVELSDEIWRKQEGKRLRQEYNDKLAREENRTRRLLLRSKFWLNIFFGWFHRDSGPRVAVAFSPDALDVVSRVQPNIYIEKDLTVGRDFVGGNKEDWSFNFEGVPQEEIWKILWDIDEYRQGRPPIVLLPGDSVVQHFVLKTTRWLTFTPIGHTFQIQVKYEIDGKRHVDTSPYSLSIRAATASSLSGAVIGSLLGSVVNSHNSLASWNEIVRVILTSSIFAIIIVVAFARKNNVQQIVSVEDFWGGLFIGFLVGYAGETFITAILGKPGGG